MSVKAAPLPINRAILAARTVSAFLQIQMRHCRREDRIRFHPTLPYSVVMTDTTTPARALFLPTARQTNFLLIVAFLCLGEAMYLRYMVMENSTMSLACQSGLTTWLCESFRLVSVLYPRQAFGWVALALALLNFVRPSILLVAVALAAAAFGVVLHNADLSALAAGVLILSLARPAPTTE
jgi:multisubunit Na+/H+ antiporter MnhF subunit